MKQMPHFTHYHYQPAAAPGPRALTPSHRPYYAGAQEKTQYRRLQNSRGKRLGYSSWCQLSITRLAHCTWEMAGDWQAMPKASLKSHGTVNQSLSPTGEHLQPRAQQVPARRLVMKMSIVSFQHCNLFLQVEPQIQVSPQCQPQTTDLCVERQRDRPGCRCSETPFKLVIGKSGALMAPTLGKLD